MPAGKELAQVPAVLLTQPHDFQNMTQLVQQSLLHFVFMVPHSLAARGQSLGHATARHIQDQSIIPKGNEKHPYKKLLEKHDLKLWESFLQGDTVTAEPALTKRQMGHKKTPQFI